MESVKLNSANLALIKRAPHGDKAVSVPSYSRNSLYPSVVHIGLGNFHRTHAAAYLDELLERGLEKTGIFEMNLIPDAFPLAEILPAQDYLYTLITKSASGEEKVRIAGALAGYVNAARDKEAALGRLADSRTLLVTLTITEKGYHYDKDSGETDAGDEDVKRDIESPSCPKTAAGFLAAALTLRYKAGGSPLTVMSCDNIPSNGKVLKNSVLFFCRALYPEIVPWVEDAVSFPSSMVDRITPVTTAALTKELEERYGISDLWPVCGEDFRQWVLEDDFKTRVPCYGEAGVQIVKDAGPYELMKMRLLNGSHSAMSYISRLLNLAMVDEGISHPLVKRFIRERYMEEVTPTLLPVPGIDLAAYKDTLIRRFSNRNIADTTARLASNGTSKIPNFMLKPLSEAVRKGMNYDAVIFALAAWARFLEGKDEQGNPIPPDDANAGAVARAAEEASSNPAGFLLAAGLAELDTAQLGAAAAKLKNNLDAIRGKGINRALLEFLD